MVDEGFWTDEGFEDWLPRKRGELFKPKLENGYYSYCLSYCCNGIIRLVTLELFLAIVSKNKKIMRKYNTQLNIFEGLVD